jgi:hypothetical protein
MEGGHSGVPQAAALASFVNVRAISLLPLDSRRANKASGDSDERCPRSGLATTTGQPG